MKLDEEGGGRGGWGELHECFTVTKQANATNVFKLCVLCW